MKPINVGLLGIGTVGGGTFTVLERNGEEITRRAGRPIRITAVADKNLELARKVAGDTVQLTDDAFSVVRDPDIDIVVELIGGYGVARELVLAAIENGKHVVTANKALLAKQLAALGVSAPEGATTADAARSMARAARERLGADIGLAVCGIAEANHPSGQARGTLHIAIDHLGEVLVDSGIGFGNTRAQIKGRAALAALDLLRRYLQGTFPG